MINLIFESVLLINIFVDMKSQELRKIRDTFWTERWHRYLPEANIITPAQDTTSLFNTSGMQQLIPYLAGKPHKLGKRLYNIQKCLRTIDIDEVWDRSHLTVFEMMWNRSLGDYFKKEAITRSREFLTQELKINPQKLAVTVFEWDENAPRDEESAKYWKQIGISENKISFMPADDNRRSPGPVGPCGSDSEIFYRVGDKNGGPELPPEWSNVKTDEDNWMEIWNNVFMEYYRDEDGLMTKLKQKNVDTGMWFGRMCCVLQWVDTIYETDLFVDIIAHIKNTTQLPYQGNEKRMRIVADHLRTACIMIDDWAIASNTGTGYILRMIIRRMYYNLLLMNDLPWDNVQTFINDGVTIVAQLNAHRNLNTKHIIQNILREIEWFRKTISNGLKILEEKFSSKTVDKLLSGKEVFMLYDTYWFPVELCKEICETQWREIDIDWFQKEMSSAKKRSRQSTNKMFEKWIDRSKYLDGINETQFVGYHDLNNNKAQLLKDFVVHNQRVLIFDMTPFYAESGGQTGDKWTIILDDWEKLTVKNVKKYEWVFLHLVE